MTDILIGMAIGFAAAMWWYTNERLKQIRVQLKRIADTLEERNA